ncbi:hypothetical protein SO694_000273108 [Aureococcus anophagefferens]|uniref:ShKT domain-containing protein n=1 Tax=Aureococcus anophagefferens TaxID=44056 RepID=A0ABR1FUZ5_AURAN
MGIVADLRRDVDAACAGIVEDGCDDFQADYDGYELYTWQLCPLSCGRCGDYEDPVCVSDSGCCCEPRGCFDDPLGIIADLGPAVGEACAGIADDGCDDFQADYNGYELYTWQLCPRSCDRCEDYEDPVCAADEGCCCDAPGEPTSRPTRAPPAPEPTVPADNDDGERCADSTSWYWKKSKNTCEDYARARVLAEDACPLTCGECEAPAPAPTPFPTDDGDCADSTSWYWKKSKYDCDYVAKKSKRCKSKYVHEESGVSSPEACPVACDACEVPAPAPTPFPADGCADSVSWYWKKSKNTCEDYVAKKSKNCDKRDDADVFAFEACPATCGECEATCADSTSWFYKKSKNTCEDYVSKKSKNCDKRDDADVFAFEACPATCGEC